MNTKKRVLVSVLVLAGNFAAAQALGPSLHFVCATGGGCVAAATPELFLSGLLGLPLSSAGATIAPLCSSFAVLSAVNSLTWGLATFGILSLLRGRRKWA
jgi:hypothetical protein